MEGKTAAMDMAHDPSLAAPLSSVESLTCKTNSLHYDPDEVRKSLNHASCHIDVYFSVRKSSTAECCALVDMALK